MSAFTRVFDALCTPEAKMPGWLDPSATRVRLKEAQEEEARQHELAAQEEFERELLQLRWEVKKLKLEHELWLLEEKYSPDQPRDDHGRWTSEGTSGADPSADQSLEQTSPGLATADGREQRSDLSQLEAIANNPSIRSRIGESWSASNPSGPSPREQGFWVSRNAEMGELFTRPFENPGSAARIIPGSPPSDAIAFFHTHPNLQGYSAAPSIGDRAFAADVGLPGILQSHNGMYYFGPGLRPPPRK
jgi:hypothetical protein